MAQFQPGQSGNPGGKSSAAKIFREALRTALKQADTQGVEAVQRVADQLVVKGIEGDVSAIREIADRIDGKVPQAVGGSDELPPVKTILEVAWQTAAKSNESK